MKIIFASRDKVFRRVGKVRAPRSARLLIAFGIAFVLAAIAPPLSLAQDSTERGAGVTDEMLTGAQGVSDAWLTYNRNYQGWRYAPLDQINAENVDRLRPVWVYQTGVQGGGFETTPIVYEGKIYITTANSHLMCLELGTGKMLWRYDHLLPRGVNLCCGPVNRGVAIYRNRIYYTTLDAHLICFDADSGQMLWDREVADYRDSYSLTLAPLIVKGKVIVGPGGAEFGVRGFIDAYDWETGERIWRFWTVPAPGEPGSETWPADSDAWKQGGATPWLTGTYDPDLDLLYWPGGNPSPDWNGTVREGDNLYSDTILALRPDTGELVWHFQNTPHDIFDWAGVQECILVDEVINGKKVKALIQANRNGYLYALNRENGEFLYAKPYSDDLNWAVMDEDGIPRIRPDMLEGDRRFACPGIFGGKNWPPSAYSPDTHMIYIPDQKRCTTYITMDVTFRRGLPYYGGIPIMEDIADAGGYIKAYDVRTGEQVWSYDTKAPNWAGLLTTSGGLVFGGAPDGYLRAFDDATGEILWEFQTGSGVFAPPTSFMIGDRQYIALASGWGQPSELVGFMNENAGSAFYLFGIDGK